MSHQRFENLPVWQQAIQLAEQVFDLTESPNLHCPGSLRDGLERAALSISSTVAEGCERGAVNELVTFLQMARGAAGEVRSMLCFMERRKVFHPFKAQIAGLKLASERCARELRTWADSLQEPETRRHLHAARRAPELKEKPAAAKHPVETPAAHALRKKTDPASRAFKFEIRS